MTWKEAFEDYDLDNQIKGVSKKVRLTHKSYFKAFLEYLEQKGIDEVRDMTRAELKGFTLFLIDKGYKESTINVTNVRITLLIRYLKEEGFLTTTDEKALKRVKEKETYTPTFTDSEAIAISKAFEKGSSYVQKRNHAIVNLLLDTGLRNAELCSLKLQDLKDNYIEVVNGKGGKNRGVPYSPQLQKIMKRYLIQRNSFLQRTNKESDYVFVSNRGKHLINEIVYEVCLKAGDIAGIRDNCQSNPHNFRHYFCSKLLMNGLDLYSVSKIMGHTNLKTTQTYLNSLNQNKVISNAIQYSVLKSFNNITPPK